MAKKLILDAPDQASDDGCSSQYLPCLLKQEDSTQSHIDYGTIPAEKRGKLVDKIVTVMTKWGEEKRSRPIPLIFVMDIFGDVTLQPSSQFQSADHTIWEYEPHFWIPETCMEGLQDLEKTFRREFFAVGCLIFQILKGKKQWEDFPGSDAKSFYENGTYPTSVLDLSHWKIILAYWSWEYVAEITKKAEAKKRGEVVKKVAMGVAIAGGSVAAMAVLSPLVLPLIGFGGGGVVGGSIAAAWQSSIGLVEAGSLFAILQSAGAGGLAGAAAIASAGAGAATTAAAAGLAASAIDIDDPDQKKLFGLFLSVVRKSQ